MSDRFDEVAAETAKAGRRLNQHLPEFRTFLEYSKAHLDAHGVGKPIIVEIGVFEGAQRGFYEEFLNAQYVGIDINPNGPADIVGDSAAPATLAKLKTLLGGRMIDLLFIDGLHTFEGVRADYETYGPLTRHIIGIHDIFTPKVKPTDAVDVMRFWPMIAEANKTDTILTIRHYKTLRVNEFNGLPQGIGIIVKSPRSVLPTVEIKPTHSPRVSVISRWFNEEFFAPYFLGHYAWADEVIVLLEKSTSDRSAEIIAKYPNARVEYTETGGLVNDHLFSDMMSDLAASLKSDWVIRADADELIYPQNGVKPKDALANADGNVIMTWFRWMYRHRTDPDLDPSRLALWQRRHGGAYTIWPGMGDKFSKPSIVRPESGIRWRPGEQGYVPNPKIRVSQTIFNGVHWQMVDVGEAVRRLLSAEKRLSGENIQKGYGVRGFTEEQIRTECRAHENDPQVI